MTYEDKCKHFKLASLESRRDMLDLRMVNKILNDKIDCPELLGRIGFTVPSLRSRRRFFVSNHRLRVTENSPIARSTNLANNTTELDVFSPTIVFRKNSTSHFVF